MATVFILPDLNEAPFPDLNEVPATIVTTPAKGNILTNLVKTQIFNELFLNYKNNKLEKGFLNFNFLAFKVLNFYCNSRFFTFSGVSSTTSNSITYTCKSVTGTSEEVEDIVSESKSDAGAKSFISWDSITHVRLIMEERDEERIEGKVN